jgi:hypothetical protein
MQVEHSQIPACTRGSLDRIGNKPVIFLPKRFSGVVRVKASQALLLFQVFAMR